MRSGKRGLIRAPTRGRVGLPHDLRTLGKRQHPVDQALLVIRGRELVLDEDGAAPPASDYLELQSNHRSAPALFEHSLEQAHEILGFLFDFDVEIANHAERALPFTL